MARKLSIRPVTDAVKEILGLDTGVIWRSRRVTGRGELDELHEVAGGKTERKPWRYVLEFRAPGAQVSYEAVVNALESLGANRALNKEIKRRKIRRVQWAVDVTGPIRGRREEIDQLPLSHAEGWQLAAEQAADKADDYAKRGYGATSQRGIAKPLRRKPTIVRVVRLWLD